MISPTVLTIAGSDSSGFSGIQNDLKTFYHFNVQGYSAVTAVTSQSDHSFTEVFYLPKKTVISQVNSANDTLPSAIKIGMLGTSKLINALKTFLKTYRGKVVLDPVFFSSSQYPLFEGSLVSYIQHMVELLPLVEVVTPNLHEAQMLVNREIDSDEAIKEAASQILSLGVKSVLLKGGHYKEDLWSQDYWTDGTQSFWLVSSRYKNLNCRGTGCALSSAIAAALAQGKRLIDALVMAKMYASQGIRLSVEKKQPAFFHAPLSETIDDFPQVSFQPPQKPMKFNPCDFEANRLYPIVDSAEKVKALLALGIKTIQLRIKDKNDETLEKEIQQSIKHCRDYQAKLWINDYWQLALRYQAYGVHLGQTDLQAADLQAIHQAGLHLGISTHSIYEVARANALQPSYIAFGPIFPTTSKAMTFPAQGLEILKYWRKLLTCPLVAIGGINITHFKALLEINVDAVAMISTFSQSENLAQTIHAFLEIAARHDSCSR